MRRLLADESATPWTRGLANRGNDGKQMASPLLPLVGLDQTPGLLIFERLAQKVAAAAASAEGTGTRENTPVCRL